MGIQPSTLRLVDLDPHEAAAEETERLALDLRKRMRALGWVVEPSPADRAIIYRKLRALCAYAVHGRPLPGRQGVTEAVEDVCRLLGLQLARVVRGEPDSGVKLILQGALARFALERGDDLSAVQVAILSGTDRDHILARASEIPGGYRSRLNKHRPWRFRVTQDLVSWLRGRQRSVA